MIDRGALAAVAVAVATRVLGALSVVLGVATLLHALLWLAPGDPVALLPNADAVREELTRQWGLDQPPLMRVWRGVSRALVGDLGSSFVVRPGAPVTELIAAPWARSAWLVGAALAYSSFIGGLVGGARANGWRFPRAPLAAVAAVPTFVAVHLAINALNELAFTGINAGWWSRPAWFALPDADSAVRTLLAIVVLGTASGALAEIVTEVENAARRALRRGHVDAARVRGEPLLPHLVRALAAPLSRLAASRLVLLIGELVILERVLLYPGLGNLLWDACLLRDYDLAVGIVLVSGVTVAAASLAADLVAVWADPRERQVLR